ncbi:unnamed protein product [Caenorhabditis angaria]|uniref:Uncharacterized protein n=1 Tax=Caenorhabditis angaria TaxID=860376 RepID=A0A9P1IQ24_9PELO|nr:unnamed protein product [Caenorhabditis angaria]
MRIFFVFLFIFFIENSQQVYRATSYKMTRHPDCRNIKCYGLNSCRKILNMKLCPNNLKTCTSLACVYEFRGSRNENRQKNLSDSACLNYEFIAEESVNSYKAEFD